MVVNASTLNGHRVLSARHNIPDWGRWWVEVGIDGEVALAGQVTLQLVDLTLMGTVLSGGPDKGRSSFRICAGYGGWGKELPAKSYANDAGVKVSTILGDAAQAVGEVIDLSTLTSDNRVGPSWVRPEGPACELLELLVPGAWYIDEGGTTRLGKRPSTPFTGKAAHGPVDRARGTVTIAAESLVPLVPGVTVDGLTAVDVQHDISDGGGIRTTIWGATSYGSSRDLAELRALIDQLYPDRKYEGVTEYRVGQQVGERFDLQPIRVSTGMPTLGRVTLRPGVAGCHATVKLGSRVLVGFIEKNPARPYIAGFEDPEGAGFVPILLKLGAGAKGPLAMATGTQGQIAALQTEIAAVGLAVTDIGLALATLQATTTVFSDTPAGTANGTAVTACGGVAGLIGTGGTAVANGVAPATSSLAVSD